MKRLFSFLLLVAMIFSLAACGGTNSGTDTNTEKPSNSGSLGSAENNSETEPTNEPEEDITNTDPTDQAEEDITNTDPTDQPEDDILKIYIQVGETVLSATLADNSSAKEFAELLGEGEITVEMHDYGSFEKVGSLPQSIVTNDEQINTEPGDIILYQGNQITIYYDTNTYSFTRLGKIEGKSQEELKNLLGNGNVTATFRLHKEESTAKKILVAYFSATGTTKKVAEYAADVMDADIYEIVPATPYSSADLNYNNNDCRANTEMNDASCRPQISGSVENMADYDIVFIGYPIWWGEAPRIVSTFVESYNFSGKTVVTFCTSGGSGHNDSSIKNLISGVNWITGKRLSGSASKSDVAAWINGLGLDITAE